MHRLAATLVALALALGATVPARTCAVRARCCLRPTDRDAVSGRCCPVVEAASREALSPTREAAPRPELAAPVAPCFGALAIRVVTVERRVTGAALAAATGPPLPLRI